jgi:hypothetical protein
MNAVKGPDGGITMCNNVGEWQQMRSRLQAVIPVFEAPWTSLMHCLLSQTCGRVQPRKPPGHPSGQHNNKNIIS